MKQKKIVLAVLLLFITFNTTGCTHWLKDEDGKIVKEPTTGQNLASDILCQPTDKNVIKTYKENDIDVKELPTCEEFTPASGGYTGVWSTLIVKPLSWLINKLGMLIGNFGWAIILATIIIRLIIFPLSRKAAQQSEGMKEAQKDLERIQKKYRNRTDQEAQMMQAQEMMQIYKKHNINPMSGCLFAFIQMPLFLAFLESLQKLPPVFEETFLGLNLGTSPLVGLFGGDISFSNFLSAFTSGDWIYIILPILVALTTFYSFRMNTATGTPEQQQQMKMMMNFMLVFIVIASFTMSSSIIVYWITGSVFTIVQNIMVRKRSEKKNVKNNKSRSKKPGRSVKASA